MPGTIAAAPSSGRAPGWLISLVLIAAIGSAALLLWAVRDPVFTGAFLAGLLGLGAILLLASRPSARSSVAEAAPRADLTLLRAALDSASGAVAITGANGALVAANQAYADWFGSVAPASLGGEGEADQVRAAASDAVRDGRAAVDTLQLGGLQLKAELVRAGFWRHAPGLALRPHR
jgi:PAS domain-containing protein